MGQARLEHGAHGTGWVRSSCGVRQGPHCSGGLVPAKTVTTERFNAEATWVVPVLFVTTASARPTSAAKEPNSASPPTRIPAVPATQRANSFSSGPPVTSTGKPLLLANSL